MPRCDVKDELVPMGNRLLEIRTKLGLSKSQLAEVFGTDYNSIARYEAGKTKPTYSHVLLMFQLDKTPELLSVLRELGKHIKGCTMKQREVIEGDRAIAVRMAELCTGDDLTDEQAGVLTLAIDTYTMDSVETPVLILEPHQDGKHYTVILNVGKIKTTVEP